MVAARSVTVKLKLDASDFNRGLAEAAARAKAFEKILEGGGNGRTIFDSAGGDIDHMTTSVNELDSSTKSLNKTLGDSDRNSRAFGKGISASNSHMSLLVQYGIALGPALVPALAAAVPLAAALGSGLAVASVGAGTAILAFQGVGDALKAMNDQAIDPTDAHLKKLQQTMDTLGPAGQDFVVFLQSLRPEIQNLQNIAQEGMFPGIQEGINEVLTQMPLLESVIGRVSTAMGELAAEGGKALTSPFWTDFFEYIRDDATDIITNFSAGFGKLFEGLSALLMDFGPLTLDISAGFANMGRSFSDWAQNLPNTQGFQDFLDYLRETGPQVLDTFANIGKAFLDLGVALSGLPAQESLLILNTLATVISGIASSPIGPGLLSVAVGLAAITRAIGLFDTIQASAVMQFLGGKRGGGTGAVSKVGGVLGGLVSQKGAIVGAIGLIGLSLTDLDEKMGVTGTLTGAAVGSVFGPWGAAAGAVVGALHDAAHANDEFNESVQHTIDIADESLKDPLDFAAQTSALADLREQARTIQQYLEIVGDDDNAESKLRDLNHEIETFTSRQGDLSAVLKEVAIASGGKDAWQDYGSGLSRLNSIATDIQPALDHMNLSLEDLRDLETEASGATGGAARTELDNIVDKIAAYNDAADSTKGRTQAVKDAMADLGHTAGTAASEVDALQTALDALLDPALNAEEAMDNLKGQIRAFASETKASAGFEGFGAGALQNKQFTRDYARNLKDVLVTMADNNATGKQLSRTLESNRAQFIQAGVAAGFSAREMEKRANAIGLTPKLVVTVFKQPGMSEATVNAFRLKVVYDSLPKEVRTELEANGIPATATVASLMAKYQGLTRYQAVTILRARDEASGVVRGVLGVLAQIPLFKTTTVQVNTVNTVTDRHLTSRDADGSIHEYANGGMWPYPSIGSQQPQIQPNKGPNGIMWAETGAGPWEAFISGHPNKRERSRDIATEVVDRLGGVAQFADGGQVGRNISPSDIGRRANRFDVSFIRDLERALKRMRHEAREVEHAEDRFRHARERTRNATERLEKAEKNEHASKERLANLRRAEREATKNQEQAEKALTRQREDLSKATQKWKDVQSELLSQAEAISSVITEQGSIFGGQGTSVSVGGILSKLRSANEDAGKFRHYIAKLRGMGLDERVIQQLLEQGPTPEGVAAARNLAQASEHQIRQINRQERQLVGVAASTGALGVRGGGNHTTVNFNIKKVETTDVHAMGREWPKQMRRALRIARSAG